MMKLKTVLISTSLAAAALLNAQPQVTNTDAKGYLERGKLMYESHNYLGAIDQLRRVSELPSCANLREEADYYIALSKFERNENGTLEALNSFMQRYPQSSLNTDVQMRIGNYYFYRGDYASALTAYSQVRERALNDDLNEDLLYRMAYCDLQLEDYKDAKNLYTLLKGTKRYNDATNFYEAYIDYANKNYSSAYKKFSEVNRVGDLGYQSQYYMCQIDYLNKKYDRTISLGESLLSDEANDYFAPEINRIVGESYYQNGKDSKARTYLNTYLSTTQEPIRRSSAYALGVMDYRAKDYSSAVKNLSKAIDGDDNLTQSAYLYTGQSQLKLGNTKAASLAFNKATQLGSDMDVKETAFYNYAVIQSKGTSDPFGSSIPLFEKFLKDYPNSKYTSDVEDFLVNVYMTTTNYDKALSSINNIAKPSAKVLKAKQTVLYKQGAQYMQNGDKTTAAKKFKEAIAMGNYDNNVVNESRLWLAEIQYQNGDYKNAAENYNTYLKSASKNDANYAQSLYGKGYTLYQQQKYSEARSAFQKAIDSGKLNDNLVSDAYDRIGDTYYYAADFKNAEASYDKAITTNTTGKTDGSMYEKAMMAGQQHEYQSKINQLDNLLKKYPESTKAPAAMLEKARALEALGKNSEAIEAYKTLAKSYPEKVEARQGLLQQALLQKNAGDVDEAITAYKEVITTAPTSDEAKLAAEDLKVIYADRGELSGYQQFLAAIPNAPQLDVNEVDRLTFESAEKAVTAETPSITKMENYLKKYPEGAYAANAKYYVGRYNYEKDNLNEALTSLNSALESGEDASWAEDALSMKSDILNRQGNYAEAISTYKQIVEKSSSDDNKIAAQMGILRTAIKTKDYTEVLNTAEMLSSNPALTTDELNEVKLDRAIANGATGNITEARTELTTLAEDMSTEYGAHAAYELAALNYEAGEYKTAETQVNKLIDSGTSQLYWIARGYILLSDIYVKQGKTSDAKEYLESLKANYPGKESDIFSAINSRLNSLNSKSSTTKTSTSTKKSNSSADNKSTKKKK